MCLDENTLSAYFDKEVPSPWKEEIEEHLAGCPECRNKMEQFLSLQKTIQSIPDPRPFNSMDLILHQIITKNSPSVLRKKVINLPLPIGLSAAAVLLVLGLSLTGILGQKNSDGIANNNSQTSETIVLTEDELQILIKEEQRWNDQKPIIVDLPRGKIMTTPGSPELLRNASFGDN